ncbi:hypothetical protein [Flagellimonas myxillae]|uniref:hypothetical protein n=1 Tax=Flagellimonas myxillae TaxID=2942214 RepID=UPI00201F8A15|nr:hypothetical protein [Muricauda myxillae]MCL6266433.1 hypothetical protein [Muricauda myxillae]
MNPDYLYCVIDEPRDLLFYPIGKKYVNLIILFVTDVTKFSELPKERKLIQSKLLNHLKEGGTLVGTHDIIYRRCRNFALQKVYGCQLNNFRRLDAPIDVEIVPEHSTNPLLEGLDDNFSLDDGELCWGDWTADANILAQTKKGFNKRKKVPMVVTRKISYDGLAIWLNSGDKFVNAPRSVSQPEEALVRILSNASRYSEEIKNYN